MSRKQQRIAHKLALQQHAAQHRSLALKVFEEVDALVDREVARSAEKGKPATCAKGCSHCCGQEIQALFTTRDRDIEKVEVAPPRGQARALVAHRSDPPKRPAAPSSLQRSPTGWKRVTRIDVRIPDVLAPRRRLLLGEHVEDDVAGGEGDVEQHLEAGAEFAAAVAVGDALPGDEGPRVGARVVVERVEPVAA